MNIVQVNNCDLAGRRFNGHDLQLSLNMMGHQAYQFVVEKSGQEKTTIPLCDSNGLFLRSILRDLERQLSINGLIYPFGRKIQEHSVFQSADIVHYHLVHNHFLSILDFPNLTNKKPSVWTVHDPWVITGNCVHPRECMGWKNGCINCSKLDDPAFPMYVDKAYQMWNIKKQVYQDIDIDIVVSSNFMNNYIRNSPLTAHFNHVHKIPFGIEVESFQQVRKEQARNAWGIPAESFVIAFRAESSEIKGLKYIIEMLDKLSPHIPVTLLAIGGESLPSYLAYKYQLVELGWQNDLDILYDFYAACDLFLMPSLVESFGLMAIEAMASGCPIVVFEDTVLPEVTFAPECGIAVPYKSSDGLRVAVDRLMENLDECRWRGEKGKELAKKHYQYKDYVNRHMTLYHEILDRKRMKEKGDFLY